jgi:hypothetical protein
MLPIVPQSVVLIDPLSVRLDQRLFPPHVRRCSSRVGELGTLCIPKLVWFCGREAGRRSGLMGFLRSELGWDGWSGLVGTGGLSSLVGWWRREGYLTGARRRSRGWLSRHGWVVDGLAGLRVWLMVEPRD